MAHDISSLLLLFYVAQPLALHGYNKLCFVRKSDFKASNIGNFGWSLWKPVYVIGINVVNQNVYGTFTFGMIFWLGINRILSHSTISCLLFAMCKNNNHSMLSPARLFLWQQKNIPFLVSCPLGKKAWNKLL